MPVGGTTGTQGVTPGSTGSTSGASPFGSKAFQNDALLNKVAKGTVPALAKGAAKSPSVQLAQVALFSLGFIQKRSSLDGVFGSGTEAAVKAFQTQAGLSADGKIGPATLKALDQAASAQITTLKSNAQPQGSKQVKYHLVADISNSAKTRLYVLDSQNKVVARYLTSPGSSAFPTQGSSFTVPQVLVRKQWTPPSSSWAANASPVPPGIDNPMGLVKLSLGAYSEYIHGIPASEEAALGKAASHGCLRMSGSNILELAEKYAEAGTQVTINRDARKGNELEQSYEDANLLGIRDRPTDAGREYMFGYLSGELGKDQSYSAPSSSGSSGNIT